MYLSCEENKKRMLAGELYDAKIPPLPEELLKAKELCWQYNGCNPRQNEARQEILRELVGKIGENAKIEPNFFCDYGYNIELGDNFYANHNLVILDVCAVKIGDNVMFGPNVSLLCAGHPVEATA